MDKLTVLLLAASAAASPIEILKVEDAEAGYGHQQSGVPGQEVEGSFYWKAPEGDEVALTYTAGEAGYLAEGAALPLSPAVPEAPAVELPVMVALTPEVAEARDAFMATFEEVKMRAEAMEAEPEPEAVEAMERRRRDTEEAMVMEAAEMEDQVAMEDMAVEAVEGAAKFQVPPHTVCARGAAHCVPVFPVSYYAPSYPHYYLPAVQQKVAGAEAEDPREGLVKTVQYLPSILPSYQYYPFSSYIPRVVQPVQASEAAKAVKTVPLYQYPVYYPGLTSLYPGLPLAPAQPAVAEEARVLPDAKVEGEDEPAALLL